MTAAFKADVAVLIGRFQPFHNGHAMLLDVALRSAQRVVLMLGSARHSRSAKNPFTWEERAAMIGATLEPGQRARIEFVPVRDHYDDRRWAQSVREQLERVAPEAGRVALIGRFKDATSYYLNHFPQWQLIAVDGQFEVDATCIRRVMFEAEDIDVSLAALEGQLPTAVRQYIRAWSRLPRYAELAREHAQVERYKAAWKAAPYPPIFSTVDAVVRTAGHVLLIRRGNFPGKGLLALPGGFVEPRERLLTAAIRELAEETGLGVLASTLADALVGVKVFDHPDRSQRGRTITHAHFFDLRSDELPDVEGGDDASTAQWVAIDTLYSMEEQFSEDHFHILDHFLHLLDDAP